MTRCCTRDEGRPFGAALRGEASNRLMLRWLKTVVVSDEEKASRRRQVGTGKTTIAEASKLFRRHQNRDLVCIPGRAWRVPVYWPGGVRCGGGVSPVCCSRTEREKACPDTVASQHAATGSASAGRGRPWLVEDVSTGAGPAGGLARSSAEAPVMGVERRGRVVRGWTVGSTGVPGGIEWKN